MLCVNNRVIIACAGSGKTTRLVTEALRAADRRIAIVTYTNNNVREITKRFCELNSGVPRHVEVMTWFGFLLRECARPYQKAKYSRGRIEGVLFVNQQSTRGVAEVNTERHYFASGGRIYSDKIARFVIECEEKSGHRVTGRLREMYTDIFVDEFQDLAGWDLEVIRMLLQSGMRITLVGDPRQHIYSTNPSSKNRQYLGVKFVTLARQWEQNGLCTIAESMNETHRCNQAICDFVNELWPGMERMTSLATATNKVAGVFRVAGRAIDTYIRRCSPQVLRHDKRAKSYGCDALNFGIAKGLQFDHVLIVPTKPIERYLSTGELRHVDRARDKLHVAVTRARHSVGFAFNGESAVVPAQFG